MSDNTTVNGLLLLLFDSTDSWD
jgi:hypothetical protein